MSAAERMEFRLVVQSRDHHPNGIYSGTTNCYALQVRTGGGPWRTLPVVSFSDLPEAEQKEIAQSHNAAADESRR